MCVREILDFFIDTERLFYESGFLLHFFFQFIMHLVQPNLTPALGATCYCPLK